MSGRGSRVDHTGEKFGRLTVVEQCVIDEKVWCLCLCECGKDRLVLANKLVSNLVTHCGCSPKVRTSAVDRVGERWGRLEIIASSVERSQQGYFMWLCRCDCGTEWLVSGNNLKAGGTESCGCRRIPRADFKDHSGKVYFDLTVLERAGSNRAGNALWRCRCMCGQECIVIGSNLATGNTKSCGCRLGRSASETMTTHGRSHDYLGRLQTNIMQRCYNKANKSYANYGGRGIAVAAEWHDSATFVAAILATIGERPTTGHSFDRINNELGYAPGNVRWSTRSEQSQNRRMGRDTEPLKRRVRSQADQLAEALAEIERLRAQLRS